MEIRQLRYFAATAELLNFTRAAERLRVAQPALSRQIRSLEEELGVTLIERDSRRVALTPAGAVFLEDAREILERIEAAEARIKRFHSQAPTALKFGYAPSLAGTHLPRIVQRLAELDSNIQVELRDLTNEEMLNGIRDRELDGALLPMASIPRNEFFVASKLNRLSFDVVMPKGSALAKLKKVSVADLAQEKLIAYDRKQYPDYWLLLRGIYAEAKLPLLVSLEVDSGSSLIASAQSGQGVAIVPASMRASAPSPLAFRPLSPPVKAFALALLIHRDLPSRMGVPLLKACQEVCLGG